MKGMWKGRKGEMKNQYNCSRVKAVSLVSSTLPQNGCHHSEDCLGNCLHIPGAVTCHSQHPECPIRSSEIMTMCNNDRTASAEEMLALVELARINCLLLPGPSGTVVRHKCNSDEVYCSYVQCLHKGD